MARIAGLPPLSSTGAKLAVALVIGSIVTMMLKGVVGYWVPLVPSMVFGSYAFWQPVTYIFVAGSPMGVIFGALILWSIGTSLEQAWGTRRFLWFTFAVPMLAAVLTLLLSLVVPEIRNIPFFGGEVITGAMWVGWGLYCGPRQSNFWGMPVTGNVLALIGVGFVVLNGVYSSWLVVIPEAFALLLTFVYLKVGRPSSLWERIQSARLQRDLKKRSSHLQSIPGGRNVSGSSDKFLH